MFIKLVKIVYFDFKKYTIFMLVKLFLIYETPSFFLTKIWYYIINISGRIILRGKNKIEIKK